MEVDREPVHESHLRGRGSHQAPHLLPAIGVTVGGGERAVEVGLYSSEGGEREGGEKVKGAC